MDWVHTASTCKGISTILMRMHPSGALKRAGASEAGGCNLGYGQHPVTTIDRADFLSPNYKVGMRITPHPGNTQQIGMTPAWFFPMVMAH